MTFLNNTPEPFESSMVQYLGRALQMPLYPSKVPQRLAGVYPRITYFVVSGSSDLVLSGPSGLAMKTIQYDCWSQSDLDSCTLREQVRWSLMGYRGMMGSTYVGNSVVVELPSMYEMGVDSQDIGTFRKSIECRFMIYEYVPRFAPIAPDRTNPTYFGSSYFQSDYFSQGYF